MLSTRLLLASGRCRPWKCLNPDFSCKTCCLRCSLSVSSRQESSWLSNAKKYEEWNQAKFYFTRGQVRGTCWVCFVGFVALYMHFFFWLAEEDCVSPLTSWSGSNVLWLLMEQRCSFSVGLCYLLVFFAKLHFHPFTGEMLAVWILQLWHTSTCFSVISNVNHGQPLLVFIWRWESGGTLPSGAETYGIVSPTREPASSQNTHSFSANGASRQQERLDQSDIRAFITFTSPESYCVLIFSLNSSLSPLSSSVCNTSQFPKSVLWFPRPRVLLSENAAEDYSSMIIDLKHLACHLFLLHIWL